MCNGLLYYLSLPAYNFIWNTLSGGPCPLIHQSDGEFCNPPSFARIKKPSWQPVELIDRHLRSHGKIGDGLRTVYPQAGYKHLPFTYQHQQIAVHVYILKILQQMERSMESSTNLSVLIVKRSVLYSRNPLILNFQLREHSNNTRSTLSSV